MTVCTAAATLSAFLVSALMCTAWFHVYSRGRLATTDADVAEATDVTPRQLADCETLWTQDLTRRGFLNHRFIGSGATGCVYRADKDGTTVAVKVSKTRGSRKIIGWKEECSDMQDLRLKQCEAQDQVLELGESFLPTCLDVGTESSGLPYMVQHLAPSGTIEKYTRSHNQPADAAAVFAQMVAAIYSLHAIQLTHNDLHGTNIVIDDQVHPPELSLVDFGSVKVIEKAHTSNYKRDANAIWRWGSQLANCPTDAQWTMGIDKAGMERAKPKFLDCVKRSWPTVGTDFMHALDLLVQGDVDSTVAQHVAELYHTSFITANLPPLKRAYYWAGAGGCKAWSKAEYKEREEKSKYQGYFRCETVPTWRDGNVKVCARDPSKAACFSLRGWVPWSCRALDPERPCEAVQLPSPNQDRTYDGACLMPGHPGYKYASDASSELRILTSTSTTTTSPTTTTSTTIASTSTTTTMTTATSTTITKTITTVIEAEAAPKGPPGMLIGIIGAVFILVGIAIVCICSRRAGQARQQPCTDARPLREDTPSFEMA